MKILISDTAGPTHHGPGAARIAQSAKLRQELQCRSATTGEDAIGWDTMPSLKVAISQAPSPESNATSVADSSISLASFITAEHRVLGNDPPHCVGRRTSSGGTPCRNTPGADSSIILSLATMLRTGAEKRHREHTMS